MDLTYMPGELDFKGTKKDSSSDMKREHDSVDDFEHLDPDLSPVDAQPKDFPKSEHFDNKTDSLSSEKASNKDHDVPEELFKSSRNDDLDILTKPSDSLAGITKDKDFMSDFEAETQPMKTDSGLDNQGKSSLMGFEMGGDISSPPSDVSFAENPNKSFISAEIINNIAKTEHESDLLSLEKDDKFNVNVKDSVTEIQGLSDNLNDPLNDENVGLEFNNSKSMKEADALPQYEMKPEKKETGKIDDITDDFDKHDPESIPKLEKLEPEPSFKSEAEVSKVDPKLPALKAESDEQKSDPFKEVIDVPIDEDTKEKHTGKEDPLKHFIAICPSKPEPTETIKEARKKISMSDLDDIIGPEDVFKRIGLDAWFTPDRLHPIVEALVYWRDPKKSGIVFGSIMVILLSLCYISLISVVAYSSLLALTGTICFRIYKNILQAVQKTSEGHPFKEFLDLELSLPQDKVREIVDTAVVHINAAIVELRRLFLVEDLIDSIKFGVCLWCLTYVGAIFNGMTLVILAFVALFTVPKIYENNKASIDTYIDMGRSKVAEITSKVKAAVPIGKKEPEKDKEQ